MKNLRPATPQSTRDRKPVNGPLDRTTRPRLPIGPEAVEVRRIVPAAEGRKVRVLFVEDDEAVAESTRRLLELEGFEVACAFNGKAGVAKALAGVYDVILLHRVLPDLFGDDVIERLRTDGNSTPIVIITGFPDYESALHAGRFNVSDYLVKSAITGVDLAASIRKATAQTVVAGPTSVEKRPLFSAYGGKTSRTFSDLVQYVRRDELSSSDLCRHLARTISAGDLTFAEFLATSKSIHLLHLKADLPFHVALSTLHDWLDPALTARPLDCRLEELLARIEAATANCPKLHIADITVGLVGNGQAELFTDPTNPTFHQCKKGVVMRRAARELIGPHEQIRQIAYRLGYSDHGNFDHDFFGFFGVSPRRFRQLL